MIAVYTPFWRGPGSLGRCDDYGRREFGRLGLQPLNAPNRVGSVQYMSRPQNSFLIQPQLQDSLAQPQKGQNDPQIGQN